MLIADGGVAGLWRLLRRIDEIRRIPMVIVVAGMDVAASRLAVFARLRRIVAEESQGFAATAVGSNMTEADVLVAEVMPFLAACRFLEKQAGILLATRRPDGGRPLWLIGTRLVVRRVPFGIVLILSRRNYPLLLPTVQVVEALAAGNAVLVKPAPGCAGSIDALAELLRRAGLPDALCIVLPDSHETGEQALAAGVDKVVLTGGEATGPHVLRRLAETLTPATMELSGDDAAIVLPGRQSRRWRAPSLTV